MRCPLYQKGNVNTINLNPEFTADLVENYDENKGIVICEIEGCPYGNRGKSFVYLESKKNLVGICNSRGKVTLMDLSRALQNNSKL